MGHESRRIRPPVDWCLWECGREVSGVAGGRVARGPPVWACRQTQAVAEELQAVGVLQGLETWAWSHRAWAWSLRVWTCCHKDWV